MDYKLFLRVFSSHDMKMPVWLLREQHCNQFPNAKWKCQEHSMLIGPEAFGV